MYYTFFGLQQPPFRITPDTEFFFEGANRGSVLEALIYAISQGEGIVKVTGEVGSGKTMLCRVLQHRLGTSVDIVYLANPNVSPEDILHAIAFELQLPVTREASRLEVMHALQQFLVQRHAENRQVVVFVEESQGMPIPTLEEIRLLSNLETDRHKLLQIVLFGQPELDENLRQNNIRQLRERITHSFYLSPLSAAEIASYLAFRLHAAGYRGPELFSKRVIAYIEKASGGLTRRVNIIADKALLAAFADNTHDISLKHVRNAVEDSEFNQRRAHRAPPIWVGWMLAGASAAVAGVVAWWFLAQPTIDRNRAGAPPAAAVPANAATIPVTDPPPSAQVAAARPETVTPAPAASPEPAAVEQPGTPPALRIASDISQPTHPANSEAAVAQAQAESLPDDFLERRLQATETWLSTQRERTYTIQLMGSADAEYLKQYFKSLAKSIETDNIFVYRTVANMKPSLTVVYGAYPSLRAVNEAIEQLPPELQRYRPYQRTIRGIRAELEAARVSTTAR